MVTSQSSSQVASSRRQQVSSSSQHAHAHSSSSVGTALQQQQQLQQQQLQQQQQQILLDRSNLMTATDDKERLQAAENRRADLMSKIGETESMIHNMEAQFKSAGKNQDAGALQNGGASHFEHYEESSSHSAHNAFRTDASGNVVAASSGSAHAHKSTQPKKSASSTTDDAVKSIGVHSKRDTAERRAKVDRLLMQVASGSEEVNSSGRGEGEETLSSTSSKKSQSHVSHAAKVQAPYSTLSSVSSSSTHGGATRTNASMQQTHGGLNSQHEHFVQQQNAQNLTMNETANQKIQRTKSSSSRLNSETMDSRGITVRGDTLSSAKSPRIIKKTIRARGGSVDNIHRGNEENVHREVTKTVTYKPVPLQAHTIVINQTKEIIRETPKPAPPPTPTPPTPPPPSPPPEPPKPAVIVVEERVKTTEKKEMCIQTEEQKPPRKTSKSCDTQTETETQDDKKKKEEKDKEHWVNVLYVEPKSPAPEEQLEKKVTTEEVVSATTINENLRSKQSETKTRKTEGEQWFTETEEIRWKVITETFSDGTVRYYTVREGDDKYVQLGETPGTEETITTENTVDINRQQQQIELRQMQQRQEELARLQQQQAQLQQQLEAATASLQNQEISTQTLHSSEVNTDLGYDLEYLPIIPTDESTFKLMADEIRRTMTSSRAVLGQLIDVKGKQSAIQGALKDVKGATPNATLQRNYEMSGKIGLVGSSEKVFRDQNSAAAAAAAMRQSHAAGTTSTTSHLQNAATAY